ncbi:MAG: bifunctional UDP-N-acetylglucosamine pyrophosphorylase / glucosamine-phosphate N-acetyltransferase [Actinomycetota bacterium]|nr:bifunctional UDP-N-acetylglucosamine pyrophosphorylase / glucosamine-phosphate N-acetyltransferase [Actinomycetota bacterium]
MTARPAAVVILAAGEGTRMRSATAKVLHELGGRSMLGHVVHAARALDPEHLIVVVGHAREQVTAHLKELDPEATAVVQAEQNGTGHAVRIALDGLDHLEGTVVVLPGDAPLVTPAALTALVAEHEAAGAATTMLTAHYPDPTGYGRVVRSGADVLRVVEHKDADPDQLRITEIATGHYAFAAGPLREALGKLSTDNAQGEEYLPDVVRIHKDAGLTVGGRIADNWAETVGVNDRIQLAVAARMLRDRINRHHMLAGVAILDPETTWIDADVVLEPDSTVLPQTQLKGTTVVRRGAVVGPDTTLTSTEVGEDATVRRTTSDGAVIGAEATVGPYSYLRPGTKLGRGAKVGAYVEVKASEIGEGSKVPHLAYVGDATIGERSNIGAGTIVVNYDGRDKHRTNIGDDVRVGSNNSLVAPVTIGDGAYTGADAVISKDVPAGALALSENTQRIIEGWVERKRGRTSGGMAGT